MDHIIQSACFTQVFSRNNNPEMPEEYKKQKDPSQGVVCYGCETSHESVLLWERPQVMPEGGGRRGEALGAGAERLFS